MCLCKTKGVGYSNMCKFAESCEILSSMQKKDPSETLPVSIESPRTKKRRIESQTLVDKPKRVKRGCYIMFCNFMNMNISVLNGTIKADME